MNSSDLASFIGTKRAHAFLVGLPHDFRNHEVELYRFDLNLRAEVIKAMSIVEIALELATASITDLDARQTFGSLRRKLDELGPRTQFHIARRFGFSTQKELKVALRNFNALRNRAAHHEPIWRMQLHFGIPQLRAGASNFCGLTSRDHYSPAASISLISNTLSYLPRLIDLEVEFDALIKSIPIERGLLLKSMGFEVP